MEYSSVREGGQMTLENARLNVDNYILVNDPS